jgi:predicted TIM-barrel fold metal-dependent hydrolase
MHDRGWGDLRSLQRNYLVADLLADAAGLGLEKSVHVQANFDPENPVAETEWLEKVANADGFPHAIVAFADFSSDGIQPLLDAHAAASPRMRGVRQVLNRHADPKLNRAPEDYLGDERWQRNLGLLDRYGWSFDAQVYHQQMPALAKLAARYPGLQLVLDHAGMPVERDEAGLEGWRAGMRQLAACPNVAVKLCGYGMVDNRWTADSIRPFVLQPIEWFGPERCMFGSNFPVDRLMAGYAHLWGAYRSITAAFTEREKALLFRDTAMRVYRL